MLFTFTDRSMPPMLLFCCLRFFFSGSSGLGVVVSESASSVELSPPLLEAWRKEPLPLPMPLQTEKSQKPGMREALSSRMKVWLASPPLTITEGWATTQKEPESLLKRFFVSQSALTATESLMVASVCSAWPALLKTDFSLMVPHSALLISTSATTE